MHTGSCLCGVVKVEIDGDLAPVQLCHCGQCRKASGTAFASNMPVRAEAFRVVGGADQLKSFESSPGKERVFCGRCGSPVISRATAAPDWVRVRVGLIDPPVGAPLAFHFHTASKADWWPIQGDLPQHPGARPQ
jgi:hypothetical protein